MEETEETIIRVKVYTKQWGHETNNTILTFVHLFLRKRICQTGKI